MKVLGISGSPRKNGTTARLVKEVLNSTGLETEFISLSGKDVKPCIECLACAGDNVCKLNDYVSEIRDKIIEADAIIVGGSNIFSSVNSLTHSFLERLSQFYHGGHSPLAGKLGIAVGVGAGSGEPVVNTINNFFRYVSIKPFDSITAYGPVSCFLCGHGHECDISNVKNCLDSNGKVDMSYMPDLSKQSDVLEKAHKLGEKIRIELEQSK